MSEYIHGLHDRGGEHLMADRPGWVVVTEAIGHDPGNHQGVDYEDLTDDGFGVLVRLNNGYGSSGTIPLPEYYDDFAVRVRRFVLNSFGLTHVIIGNEPNHSQERPDGQPISPAQYAACYRACWEEIKTTAGDIAVLPAPVAPWNLETGDWLDYWQEMLERIGPERVDGIVLHAYTHGADPALASSEVKMQPPYALRYWHFRAYRDFLLRVPPSMRHLPAYITETNQGDHAWVNDNLGWHRAIYGEVATWNAMPSTQKIHAVCSYRWPLYDQWGIENKRGTILDFLGGVSLGIARPQGTNGGSDRPTGGTQHVYLPIVVNGDGEGPVPQPPGDCLLIWDDRLTQRGVTLTSGAPSEGTYWCVQQALFYNEQEADVIGPDHHVLVDVVDENGDRLIGATVRFYWADGHELKQTEAKPDQPYAVDFAMYAGGRSYGVYVEGLRGSDQVFGMGLGERVDPPDGTHVSYGLIFQRATRAVVQPEPQPAPQPAPPPLPSGAFDPLLLEAIIAVESGGNALGADGRPLIRFEAHIFDKRYPSGRFVYDREAPWEGHKMFYDNAWQDIHTGRQESEYRALELARIGDYDAAYESISMGLGQIMGFHYARLGYASAYAMYEAFSRGAVTQLIGMLNFILSSDALAQAVRTRDFRTIALLYNGSGQVDRYAALIERKYEELRGG